MSPALRQLQLPFDVPPRAEIAGRLRQLQLAGGILSYHLVRAKRRTIALFVDGDGIEARAPRHVAIADIETFIREKERWIRKRLAEPRRRPLVWETGARLPWLGCTVTLALRHGEIGVWLSEDRLELGLADGASLRERALDWMRTQALEFFRERIAELVRLRGLRVLAVGLSNARTRWGSCGSNGRILLNWRLMMLPPHLIDYVAAHELAHLRELNHSPRFWGIVALLYPDFRAARRELNARAPTLPDL
ncbi:MAG TPA: SprT family zinc-dependent metalloprotease [Burkholderiales bacterium]|nr:SprT family zinc-dependent metalloprotease [Burkholderiales bacterium]